MLDVNRSLYLTHHRHGYSLNRMKYGERLRAARKHAKLSQAALAEAVGIAQPSVQYLEDIANDAQGSEHTARFARVCKVSADWLSDEIGEMEPTSYMITDPRIAAIARMLEEERADYLVDKIQKDLAADIELMRAATARAKGNDC
jgi:transcriptional regulator with XRE-family HTH domain